MPLDFATEVNTLKNYKKSFILSPIQWNQCSLKKLNWEYVKFNKSNKNIVPEVRGVYCFVIMHKAESFPPNSYISYIGITGDKSNRTLKNRFNDYLREEKNLKRAHIHYLLTTWSDDLYFYYVSIPDTNVSLSSIETQLLNAIIPPGNKMSFSGTFGQTVSEAWR